VALLTMPIRVFATSLIAVFCCLIKTTKSLFKPRNHWWLLL